MDLNVRAFRTVQAALEEVPQDTKRKKEASRRGGLAGGKSRAKTLTSDRKKEIARAANAARWRTKTPATVSQGEER
jgi:hypothetical protein